MSRCGTGLCEFITMTVAVAIGLFIFSYVMALFTDLIKVFPR